MLEFVYKVITVIVAVPFILSVLWEELNKK